MKLIEKQLEEGFKEAIQRKYADFNDWSKLFIQKTNNEQFGDFQTNFAMTTSKLFQKNPRQLAQEIIDTLGKNEMIEKMEIAGPGFINIFLTDKFLGDYIKNIGEEIFDFSFVDHNGDVVIDYSGPNIAKRMHIGHLRSTVIGDSIKRIYRFLGYRVIGDNHLGDWGTQFGKLIVGFREWLDREAYNKNPIEELERIYVDFEKKLEADPLLQDKAREELKKLQDGDPENRKLWQEFIDVSMKEYEIIYKRLDIEFDTYYGESYYHTMMPDIVRELTDKGIAKVSEGALVVMFDEGENLPVSIIQKKDGAYLYATSDLACMKYRKENYFLNRIIYLSDDRQQTHFRQFFRISDILGWNVNKIHVWFGVMRFPDGIFSSRKGNVIKLEDLLNEAVRRARDIIEEKNPDLPEEEKLMVSEAVGIGAVKYFDLSQNRVSGLVFEWEKALNFDGNTAPYLQYTYARIQSILRKAKEQNKVLSSGVQINFKEKIERSLAVILTQFPYSVIKAAENYQPNFIADYLFNLAQTFNSFYNSMPVLKENDELLFSRLLLSERTARVIKSALNLLGIKVVDRM